MTIIETGKFNARLFDRLPNSEKPLFKKLIDVAKLKHKLGAGNLVDENEKQQLQRWELVRGELESGNDNSYCGSGSVLKTLGLNLNGLDKEIRNCYENFCKWNI
jgi:hypothetical protein